MGAFIGANIPRHARTRRPRTSWVLWLAAGVIMLGAATWQRLTGPTHPRRGRTEIAGQEVRWRLLRSQDSGEPLRVSVAVPEDIAGTPVTGTVHFRRFPTEEPFQALAMSRQNEALVGFLPTQPPAGKLEYFVVLDAPGGPVRLPEGEPLLARFKGHVPLWILLPHVLAMFFAMLIGVRAALATALGRPETRALAWLALLGITLGGMILGPIVQKHAFGAYWTGWPLGGDLTDNKTAAMWLAWIAAVALLQRRRDAADRMARAGVAIAALVMMAVYVIPHSLRGSQLDYRAVEAEGTSRESTPAER